MSIPWPSYNDNFQVQIIKFIHSPQMKPNNLSPKIIAIILLLTLANTQNTAITNCQHYKIDSQNISRCTICARPYRLNLNYTKCLPCASLDPYCLRCDANPNGALFCQACIDGYQVAGSKCSNTDECSDPHCNTCSQKATCNSCNTGHFLKANANTCSPCPASNQIDQGNGSCICPPGTYLSVTQNIPTCTACQFPCQNCNQSASSCTLCIYGYFMASKEESRCQLCLTPNCIICQEASVCLNCTLGYLLVQGVCQIQLQQQNINNYINLPEFYYFCLPGCFYCYKYDFCVTCLEGYSRNLYNDACQKCSPGCQRCESLADMQCFACYQGYLLANSTCVRCKDINCLTCSQSFSVCVACARGFTAVNGTCQPCAKNCKKCDHTGTGACDQNQCLSGYARVSNTTCALCALGCYSCSPVDISTCISCPIGSFQVAGGQCQICPSACVTCLSNSSCTTCRDGFRIVNNLCYKDCTYPCLDCSPYNARICSTCYDGYSLAEDMTCQPDISCNNYSNCTICPVKYYLNLYTDLCLPCQLQQNCIKCETEAAKCAICSDGFYLFQNSCLPCTSSCLTCQLQSFCFDCQPGFYLFKQDSSQVYGECKPCSENCLTCVDEFDKCNSCNYTEDLIGFDCVTSQNIIFQITLQDTSLGSANAEEYAFIKQVVAFTNAIANAFGPPYSTHPELLFLKDISTGSIQVSYMATVANLDPRILLPTIINALSSLTTFGGFTVISTQIVTNGFQADVVMEPSSTYFYAALTPSPFFLFFMGFLVYTFFRQKANSKDREEPLEVRLEPMETGKSLKGEENGAITL